MKICSVCFLERDEGEFYPRQSRCKTCHNEYTRQHYIDNKRQYLDKAKKARDKIRARVREIKSRPCQDCGKSYPYYVMDFDHRENKEFNISEVQTRYSWSTIEKEIAKCDIVCANCHRIRSHERYVSVA